MYSSSSKLSVFIVSLLVVLAITACIPSTNASSPGTYPVDSVFADFYRELGGLSVLGPAITPVFTRDGIPYQYVVSGLMAYEAGKLPLERFHFSPIASIEWNINDLIEPAPVENSGAYVNGHHIWEEVLPFYNRYGSSIIGLPITGVKANDEKQRYEQFFEGLGFYRNYADPPGKIKLMPYGSWMCADNCQFQVSDDGPPAESYIREFSETEQLFIQASDNFGYGFTGLPLAHPAMGSEGHYEMTFENVVLYIDPAEGNQIKLKPLPSWLGIQPDSPTSEIKADWLSFYPITEGLGYNVPRTFSDYIVNHGGWTVSGTPITEYRQLPDGGYSQCFTNLCLEYHPTAPEQLRIRPHALGVEYQKNGINSSVPDTIYSNALQLNVWEQLPLIPSGQVQTIFAEALMNNAPVPGVELSLVVKQPDGIVKSYLMNPTDEDGSTSIELDPINGPNGSIVQYQVCMLAEISPQVCFSRDYTIWNQ